MDALTGDRPRTTRRDGRPVAPDNRRLAQRLREAAHLLCVQGASSYRVNAYRAAADAVERHPRALSAVFEDEGVKGLDAIPHVGLGIAAALAEMLVTQRWALLDRLRGSVDPAMVFQSVPGVGPALARRIHDTLHIDTLEDFEAAAHDGRLEAMAGVGSRRAAGWRASLDEMLGRIRPSAVPPGIELPSVDMLLAIDREYREGARAGRLRRIAPKRFNPEGEAWLPLLHAQRGAWHFTALFSNTALAHRLDRVHDWVVIYFYDGDHVERQCTVVTEPRGALAGRRVVRGREGECRAYYAAATASVEPAA